MAVTNAGDAGATKAATVTNRSKRARTALERAWGLGGYHPTNRPEIAAAKAAQGAGAWLGGAGWVGRGCRRSGWPGRWSSGAGVDEGAAVAGGGRKGLQSSATLCNPLKPRCWSEAGAGRGHNLQKAEAEFEFRGANSISIRLGDMGLGCASGLLEGLVVAAGLVRGLALDGISGPTPASWRSAPPGCPSRSTA